MVDAKFLFGLLLSQGFFGIAYFALQFTADFLGSSFIPHRGVHRGLADFLFDLAFRFAESALDFVFCACFHETKSLERVTKSIRIVPD
jgi:hypothetical protein